MTIRTALSRLFPRFAKKEPFRALAVRIRSRDIRAYDVSLGAVGDTYFLCFSTDERVRNSYCVAMDADEAAMLRDMLVDTVVDLPPVHVSSDAEWQLTDADNEQIEREEGARE